MSKEEPLECIEEMAELAKKHIKKISKKEEQTMIVYFFVL